jgi:hypothetical protein
MDDNTTCGCPTPDYPHALALHKIKCPECEQWLRPGVPFCKCGWPTREGK